MKDAYKLLLMAIGYLIAITAIAISFFIWK